MHISHENTGEALGSQLVRQVIQQSGFAGVADPFNRVFFPDSLFIRIECRQMVRKLLPMELQGVTLIAKEQGFLYQKYLSDIFSYSRVPGEKLMRKYECCGLHSRRYDPGSRFDHRTEYMTLSAPELADYLCDMAEIERRIDAIDPQAYDKSRNHLDGAVTWLSPFLTHGVIDTRLVAERVLRKYPPEKCYRLLFELAWREYFHRVWQQHGDDIFNDMRQAQTGEVEAALPRALLEGRTGITVVDDCLEHLQHEGLMHNHARLWVAGITCNLSHTHWYEAARWFHYHLLDGDLASNTLSWQWVAGTFSNKAYVANQDNINKYSSSTQKGTWLDVPYEAFEHFRTADPMVERADWQVVNALPASADSLLPGKPVERFEGSVALHSLWQLDPFWRPDAQRRILFIDKDWHQAWPMSEKRWRLIRHWAGQLGLEIQYGTVEELHEASAGAQVTRREYTACRDWPGAVEERSWLYPFPDKSFNSFSAFWKQVRGSAGL